MTNKSDSTSKGEIDPHLKEQNDGIFSAFALENHKVLTTSEIESHVDNIGIRQVRRRLNNLEDKGIVGSRKPGRTKLWWLQEEIEEPVSLRYPIVKLIRERLSLQLILLGVLMGIVTVVFTTAATLMINYEISPPYITVDNVIVAGLVFSLGAALFLLAGGAIAGTVWLFRHLGIEIRYNPDD